jgi:hypothetical protein
MPWDQRHSQGLTIHPFKQLQTAQHNNALVYPLLVTLTQLLRWVGGRKKAHGPTNATGLTSAEAVLRDLLAEEKTERAVNRAVNHVSGSTDEENHGLLTPFTMPPRVEESGSTKRTRGRIPDLMTLHMGIASKKGKP